MIIKRMKKILSSIVIAAYLIIYVAPIGFCASAVPQLDANVSKPALRSAEPSSLKLEGDISLTKGNPKISLSLRDSDATQVLRMFADKAGLNIIFHQSVFLGSTSSGSSAPAAGGTTASNGAPKITMDLVNVPLNDAFKMVLQVANLTYYIDHNTMVVISASSSQALSLSEKEMMTIPVKYSDAAVIADFLNKNIFSRNRPGISNAIIAITNPSRNEILIFGTKNDYLMAKKIVAQFDMKPREETFTVNHSTPAEMSALICSLLYKSFSGSTAATGVTAANTSANSAGGGSTSSATLSATGSSSSAISLGAGVTACTFNNSVSAGSLISINQPSVTVTYFPQKGNIMIRGGSAEQMQMVKEFIAKTDVKQPQAYLEISIVELNETGSKEFNNNWKIWSGFFSGSFDGTGLSTNPLSPNFLAGDGYSVWDTSGTTPKFLYDIAQFTGPRTISYTMNYLVKNGKGRILANPRILVTNGQESVIDLTSDYVSKIDANTTATSAGSVTTYTYTIANDDGIKVNLTPYISPEGYVTLNIKPNYATIKEEVPGFGQTANITVATLLQRSNLDLKNIRIKDGETLAIGGMVKETETKSIAKIPVLGDLPGVGMFFRNSKTKKEKSELVIMLTPKIVKDSEDIVKKQDTTL